MNENFELILKRFNDSTYRKQIAYLDIMQDLLLLQNTNKNRVTPEMELMQDAIKETIETSEEDFDYNKLTDFFIKLSITLLELIGNKWFWLFSYFKPKDKLSNTLTNEYWFIDDEIYKIICQDRNIFIHLLVKYWFVEKIDFDDFKNNFIKSLSEKVDYIEDLETKANKLFVYDEKEFFKIDEDDKDTKRYFDIMWKLFPHTNILEEAKNDYKKIHIDLFYYDKEKLLKLYNTLLDSQSWNNEIIYIQTDKWCNLVKWNNIVKFSKHDKPIKIVKRFFKDWKNKPMNLTSLHKLLYWEPYERAIHKEHIEKIWNIVKWINKKVKPLNNWNQYFTFKGQILAKKEN